MCVVLSWSDYCEGSCVCCKQKTAYELRISDWSSDVCSSDRLFGIGAEERGIKPAEDLGRLLGKIARQPERRGDAAAMVRLDPGGGVDGDGVDFFGRVVRGGFDVHAALGRGGDRAAAGGAVGEQGEVEFRRNVGTVGDVEAVYLFARVAGMDRYWTGA